MKAKLDCFLQLFFFRWFILINSLKWNISHCVLLLLNFFFKFSCLFSEEKWLRRLERNKMNEKRGRKSSFENCVFWSENFSRFSVRKTYVRHRPEMTLWIFYRAFRLISFIIDERHLMGDWVEQIRSGGTKTRCWQKFYSSPNNKGKKIYQKMSDKRQWQTTQRLEGKNIKKSRFKGRGVSKRKTREKSLKGYSKYKMFQILESIQDGSGG